MVYIRPVEMVVWVLSFLSIHGCIFYFFLWFFIVMDMHLTLHIITTMQWPFLACILYILETWCNGTCGKKWLMVPTSLGIHSKGLQTSLIPMLNSRKPSFSWKSLHWILFERYFLHFFLELNVWSMTLLVIFK